MPVRLVQRDSTDSAERNNTKDATGFRMLDGYLKAYALYFSKFIRAYEKEGVTISAVYPQTNHAPIRCSPVVNGDLKTLHSSLAIILDLNSKKMV